jgi:hypothetical protein
MAALTSIVFDTRAMTDRKRSLYRDFSESGDPQKVDQFNDKVFHIPKRQKFQPGQLMHTQRATLSSPLQPQNRVKRHHLSNLPPDRFSAEV